MVEIVTVLALLFSFIGSLAYLRERRGVAWREATADIQRRMQPGDILLVMPEKAKYTFGYYFQDDGNDHKVFSVTEVNDALALAPSLFSERHRIWIVRDRVVSSTLTGKTLAGLEQHCDLQANHSFFGVDVVLAQPRP